MSMTGLVGKGVGRNPYSGCHFDRSCSIEQAPHFCLPFDAIGGPAYNVGSHEELLGC